MNIHGKWYDEPGILAYISRLEKENEVLKIEAQKETFYDNTADGDTIVYAENYVDALAIFEGTIIGDGLKQIPLDKFTWEETTYPESSTDVFRYLTLDEIVEQYKERGGMNPLLTVVVYEPLGGTIYQYGNSNDGKWYIAGTLRGYA